MFRPPSDHVIDALVGAGGGYGVLTEGEHPVLLSTTCEILHDQSTVAAIDITIPLGYLGFGGAVGNEPVGVLHTSSIGGLRLLEVGLIQFHTTCRAVASIIINTLSFITGMATAPTDFPILSVVGIWLI